MQSYRYWNRLNKSINTFLWTYPALWLRNCPANVCGVFVPKPGANGGWKMFMGLVPTFAACVDVQDVADGTPPTAPVVCCAWGGGGGGGAAAILRVACNIGLCLTFLLFPLSTSLQNTISFNSGCHYKIKSTCWSLHCTWYWKKCSQQLTYLLCFFSTMVPVLQPFSETSSPVINYRFIKNLKFISGRTRSKRKWQIEHDENTANNKTPWYNGAAHICCLTEHFFN